jgi:hypothetical protein
MVNYANSNRLKKKKEREALDQIYTEALEALRDERTKAKEEGRRALGAAAIAKQFPGVVARTLLHRDNGLRSISEFNQTKQKLCPEKESELTEYIKECGMRGLPLAGPAIQKAANKLLDPGVEDVGKRWLGRFGVRQYREIKAFTTKHLDASRADGLNPTAIKSFEDIVEEEIGIPNITPDLIYGMDETGFNQTNDSKMRSYGKRKQKGQYKRGGGRQENITAVITICADGTIVQPGIIFKGANISPGWYRKNPANAV